MTSRTAGRIIKIPRTPPEVSVTRAVALARKLFDNYYYWRHNPEVKAAGTDPLGHYLAFGWKQGRNPRADFDTFYYMREHSAKIKGNLNPFLHYALSGRAQGLRAFDPETLKRSKDPLFIIESEFDSAFYLERYPDVAEKDIDPLQHYCFFGFREGRWPNADFDTRYYVDTNPDVLESGINPFLHYLVSGRAEGRPGRAPLLSVDRLPSGRGARNGAERASANASGEAIIDRYVYDTVTLNFDYQHYARYFWNAARPSDPVFHYLTKGYKEGKDPRADFSTAFYLSENSDVAKSGINPFFHFVVQGRNEGRVGRPEELASLRKPASDRRPTALAAEHSRFSNPGETFEPLDPAIVERRPPRAKAIAFYLPQFHAIPENDRWWGEGFTEWRNVVRAVPRFADHFQPRIPRDLGFYDLENVSVMRRQAALARAGGIYGFGFYYYSFNGRRILERPIEQFLATPDIEMPFMLVWANENWTRTWDGFERNVLLAQDYRSEDEEALIADFARHFADPRCIRIEGRPLLTIYRPGIIPDSKETIARWRNRFERDHGVNPILFMMQGFDDYDPRKHGLDGAMEFPPHKIASGLPAINHTLTMLDDEFSGHVMDYDAVVERSLAEPPSDFPLIRGVAPTWDNDARRPGRGMVLHGSTPDRYEAWLRKITENALANPVFGESLVAINAWNEWAEGAYLEPDVHFGCAYLNATARALTGTPARRSAERMKLVIVGHDAYRHGAQILVRNMARVMRDHFNVDLTLMICGEGPLLADYRAVAPTMQIDPLDSKTVETACATLAVDGFGLAIVNTTVSGKTVDALRRANFKIVCLIHELPQLIRAYRLEDTARAIVTNADKVVFPAAFVRDRFLEIAGSHRAEIVIRPQGLYNKAVAEARSCEETRNELKLPPDTRVVIGVGYGDHRKGFDIFVDVAKRMYARRKDVDFVWVGDIDGDSGSRALKRHVKVTGFVPNVEDFYALADVFFLSSREDPFPSTVLEAMTAGLPVVGFEGCGGCDDLVAEHGTLLESRSPGVICDAIEAHLDAPRRLREESALRRKMVIARDFRFEDYCHDLLRFLDPSLARISAIVPNYNYERHIGERLKSVFDQVYPLYETIVLDDHSSDGSVAAIRECAAKAGQEIALIVNDENSGSVFRQWRKGAELARGDYVWIAEADDVADPAFLKRVVEAMIREDAALGFCDSWQMDTEGKILGESYKPYMNEVEDYTFDNAFVIGGREFLRRFLSVKNVILNVSGVVWRRDALIAALEAAGDRLLDYKVAGDWRLYAEVCSADARVVYEPAPLNGHRRHRASVTHALANARHYGEILDMQGLIAERVEIDARLREKREAHLREVRRHLGMSEAEAETVAATAALRRRDDGPGRRRRGAGGGRRRQRRRQQQDAKPAPL